MRATIKDVAREAGVSVSTVSYVLQRRGKPRTDAQKRVMEAVERLKYIPSATARNLVQKKTNAIGVVIKLSSSDGFHDPHFAQEMGTINYALADRGYWMNLFLPPKFEDDVIRTFLRDASIDGLIWTSQPTPEYLHEIMESRHLPFVQIEHNDTEVDLFSSPYSDSTACRIIIDYLGGLRTAIKYLHELGHEKIALMGFLKPGDKPEHISASENFNNRISHKVYAEQMQELGLDYNMTLYGSYTSKSANQAFLDMLETTAESDRPTAIVALSDPMAYGIMTAARKSGISIPEDLSVIGFDDAIITFSDQPPLTTMKYPFDATIQHALDYLSSCIDDEEVFTPEPKVFTSEMQVRQSTAKPKNK